MQPARLPPQCHLIIRHCFELRHSGFVIFSVFFRNSSLVSVQEVRFRPLNTRKKSKIAVGATWPAPLAPLSFVSRVSWADVFFKIRKAMRGRIALTKRFPHTDGQREMPAESVPRFGKRTARRVKRPSLRPAARNQLSTLNSPPLPWSRPRMRSGTRPWGCPGRRRRRHRWRLAWRRCRRRCWRRR